MKTEFERIFACSKGTLPLELSVPRVNEIHGDRTNARVDREKYLGDSLPSCCCPVAMSFFHRSPRDQPFPSPPTRSLPFARSKFHFNVIPFTTHTSSSTAPETIGQPSMSTDLILLQRIQNRGGSTTNLSTTLITRYSNVFVELVIKRGEEKREAIDERSSETNRRCETRRGGRLGVEEDEEPVSPWKRDTCEEEAAV